MSNDQHDLKDELWQHKWIALVTGSATGLGANIARDLAATGRYFVIVTGRDELRMSQVVTDCNQVSASAAAAVSTYLIETPKTISAVAFRADLMDFEQIDLLIGFVARTFGRLDVLVNNACWRGDQSANLLAGDQSYDDFKKVMHINVSVPMYLIHKCLIPLQSRVRNSTAIGDVLGASTDDKSVVVNISSVASQIVVPLHSYSISKACLSEMSHQLANDEQLTNVLSITISPGPLITDERPHHVRMSNMTLMDWVGNTQEVSNLVLFTIDNARLFNGKEINIDGGYLARQKLVSSS